MDETRKEYHRAYNKVWYEKNKVKRRSQIAVYAKAHPADSVRRTQAYRDRNKEIVYSYGRSYNKTIAGTYRSYKSHAARKNREFILTPAEFTEIIARPCVYCGEDVLRIGIDRINNDLGYTKENSAPCCKLCNMMKKALPVSEFLSHVKKIFVHNKL